MHRITSTRRLYSLTGKTQLVGTLILTPHDQVPVRLFGTHTWSTCAWHLHDIRYLATVSRRTADRAHNRCTKDYCDRQLCSLSAYYAPPIGREGQRKTRPGQPRSLSPSPGHMRGLWAYRPPPPEEEAQLQPPRKQKGGGGFGTQ